VLPTCPVEEAQTLEIFETTLIQMVSVIRPALLAPIFSQSAIAVTNFPENDGWRALDEEPQAAGFGGR
jgi:hypothetical protein